MKRYAVHNTGEWIRSDDWTAATRTDSTVIEYESLSGMDSVDRAWFNWMLENGQCVLTIGSTVYQIRKEGTP